MDRRLALTLPSLVLLALTAVGWWLWPPAASEPRLPWYGLIGAGLAAALALLAGAALLERTVPSFARTSRRLERLVRDLRLSPGAALAAALLSGVSEELFFRGWLLPTIGVWWQALLFMALHPAGRSGWAYTAYTGVAGVAFGALTLATGSLWPALIAHVAVNLHGFSLGGRGHGDPPRPAVRRPNRVESVGAASLGGEALSPGTPGSEPPRHEGHRSP